MKLSRWLLPICALALVVVVVATHHASHPPRAGVWLIYRLNPNVKAAQVTDVQRQVKGRLAAAGDPHPQVITGPGQLRVFLPERLTPLAALLSQRGELHAYAWDQALVDGPQADLFSLLSAHDGAQAARRPGRSLYLFRHRQLIAGPADGRAQLAQLVSRRTHGQVLGVPRGKRVLLQPRHGHQRHGRWFLLRDQAFLTAAQLADTHAHASELMLDLNTEGRAMVTRAASLGVRRLGFALDGVLLTLGPNTLTPGSPSVRLPCASPQTAALLAYMIGHRPLVADLRLSGFALRTPMD